MAEAERLRKFWFRASQPQQVTPPCHPSVQLSAHQRDNAPLRYFSGARISSTGEAAERITPSATLPNTR